jgi:hypothetical protein
MREKSIKNKVFSKLIASSDKGRRMLAAGRVDAT